MDVNTAAHVVFDWGFWQWLVESWRKSWLIKYASYMKYIYIKICRQRWLYHARSWPRPHRNHLFHATIFKRQIHQYSCALPGRMPRILFLGIRECKRTPYSLTLAFWHLQIWEHFSKQVSVQHRIRLTPAIWYLEIWEPFSQQASVMLVKSYVLKHKKSPISKYSC